jgi:hypothetical protein
MQAVREGDEALLLDSLSSESMTQGRNGSFCTSMHSAQVSVGRGMARNCMRQTRPYTTCQLGVEQLREKDTSVVIVNN